MPQARDPAQHRRVQTRKLIEDVLAERQQTLVLLWELSKLDLDTVDQTVLEMLEDFQELLVDYIAAGHFGLYQRIGEGSERRLAVLELARELYPAIARTTDAMVELTERYDTLEPGASGGLLAADLSRLGEQLAARIEHEDRLIAAMLGPDFVIPRAGAAD